MAGDVWLHVGTGKTGTSAVQVALARHRDALAAAGLFYPKGTDDETVALEGGTTSGNAKRLGWLGAPRLRPLNFDPAPVQAWLDGALAEAGDRPVLFSSETLQAPVPESIAPLLARLRAGGRRVRVLYLVRHALDYAVAGYAQGLKVGDPPDRSADLATHLAGHRVPFDRQLSNWARILGGPADITCRVYEEERLGEGLPRNLLRAIDPAFAEALPADAAPEAVNRTPTGIELALYDRLARRVEAGGPLAARLLTRAVLNAPAAIPAPIVVPEASFAAFARLNTPVVEAVNREFLGGGGRLRLTSGRIPVVSDAAPAWPVEAILDTAVALLLGLAGQGRVQGGARTVAAIAPPAGEAGPAVPGPAAEAPGPSVAVRARRLAAEGQMAEAIRLLDAAIRTAPEDPALVTQRARIARRARRQG